MDPVLEPGHTGDDRRDAQEATEDRQRREHPERDRHRGGGLVRLHLIGLRPALFALEGQHVGADHVKAGKHRRDKADGKNEVGEEVAVVAILERASEDLVLRPEAGQRRDTRDGKRGDEERDIGLRHVLGETAHRPHVLRIKRRCVDFGCRLRGFADGFFTRVSADHPALLQLMLDAVHPMNHTS